MSARRSVALVTATVVVALAGCGGTDAISGTPTAPEATEVETTASDDPPETTRAADDTTTTTSTATTTSTTTATTATTTAMTGTTTTTSAAAPPATSPPGSDGLSDTEVAELERALDEIDALLTDLELDLERDE